MEIKDDDGKVLRVTGVVTEEDRERIEYLRTRIKDPVGQVTFAGYLAMINLFTDPVAGALIVAGYIALTYDAELEAWEMELTKKGEAAFRAALQ